MNISFLIERLRTSIGDRKRRVPSHVIAAQIDLLILKVEEMSQTLSQEMADLKTHVTEQTTVIAGATAFIAGLSTKLSDALAAAANAGATADQLAEVTELDRQVKANTAGLAAAIATVPAGDPATTISGGADTTGAASAIAGADSTGGAATVSGGASGA